MLFTPAQVIRDKRDGLELKNESVQRFIQGLFNGEVTDYQASAFLMATYFQGMTQSETVALTQAMVASGERYDLRAVPDPKVDKHSTGGVGDKVSLILAPLAAACGLRVPMMAGRGLGHTGGTVDKLQAIPGFNAFPDEKKFHEIMSKVGCVMFGQSEKIAPADRKLYALRDVTGTVECIPLIVASILSKKIAEGSDYLILDVKVGNGAFMRTKESARKLARALIKVAEGLNLPTRAILTDMNQPLGYAVGNSLEVVECVEILQNRRYLTEAADCSSADLKELTIHLCAHMLQISNKVRSLSEGRKLALKKLTDGSAWKTFAEMTRMQGGSVESIENPLILPISTKKVVWNSRENGYLSKFQTERLGQLLVEMGGGRKKAADLIDPSVGLIFHKKLGSPVKVGTPLVTVFAPEKKRNEKNSPDLAELEKIFCDSIEITRSRKKSPPLVIEQIG